MHPVSLYQLVGVFQCAGGAVCLSPSIIYRDIIATLHPVKECVLLYMCMVRRA